MADPEKLVVVREEEAPAVRKNHSSTCNYRSYYWFGSADSWSAVHYPACDHFWSDYALWRRLQKSRTIYPHYRHSKSRY